MSPPVGQILVDRCTLAGAASLLDHGARLRDTEYCNNSTIFELCWFVVSCWFLGIPVLLGSFAIICWMCLYYWQYCHCLAFFCSGEEVSKPANSNLPIATSASCLPSPDIAQTHQQADRQTNKQTRKLQRNYRPSWAGKNCRAEATIHLYQLYIHVLGRRLIAAGGKLKLWKWMRTSNLFSYTDYPLSMSTHTTTCTCT